jgi:vancomycin resistance protein YoaR
MPPARNQRRAGFSWRQLALVLGIALVALIATIVFVACADSQPSPSVNTDGKILTGVSVSGVDIGGLDRAQAEAKLRGSLPDVSSGKLIIRIGSLEQNVTYASVSRAYDLNAILDQALAYGHDGNPLSSLLGGSGPVDLTPAVTYDADELARQVNAFVAAAQAQPINATISYENGEYVMTPASDGRSVDGNAVLASAGTLMANGEPADQTLDVPVTVIPADIGSDAAQAAIARAQAVTSQPLIITAGGSSFTVDTATLRTWVTLEQTSPGQWTLTVDEAAVTAYINTIKSQVDQAPVEASWHFTSSGDAVVEPGRTGYVVDAVAGTQQVVTALSGAQPGQPVGPVALTVVATEPDFTTAEAQAAVDKIALLGTWTTHYIPSTLNGMGQNIRRPAELINGTVVQPGAQFSFVGVAGPITEANGYTSGAAIIHGNTKEDGVLGGGLCSASTTMFNAALRAGFQIDRRYNHAFYISRYPIGLDATIWISGSSVKNMAFTNDSKYPLVIRSINKKRSVTFQVWGVSDGRTVHLDDPIVTDEQAAAEWYKFTDTLAPRETKRDEFTSDGFNSEVTRTVRDANGNIIHQDTFTSHYNRTDGIILVGRYPGDPVAGTLIPYGPLPPPPGPTPTPTPGPVTNPPTAGFSYSVNGATVSFTNTSSGATSYDWNFDDGTAIKHGTNPSHTYTTTGDYTVTLTATNSMGSDTHPETFHVEVPPPTPGPTATPAPTATTTASTP